MGHGAVFALGPFGALLAGAAFAPPDFAPALGLSALAWIVGIQFTLYRRINALFAERGEALPMHPHWVILPGLNLVAGLRSVHFLAVHWAYERGQSIDDPIVSRFPFLGTPTLQAVQLLTTPQLWVRLR